MTAVHRDERGVESVEFAIVVPLLLLFALGTYPLLNLVAAHRDMGRIADAAALYATRVAANPAATSTNAVCGSLTRRHSYAEVDDYARLTQPELSAVDVFIQEPSAPEPDTTGTSAQDPCTAPATSRVHVKVSKTFSTGPLASLANAMSRLVSGENLFPATATATATAAAYLE